MPGPYQPYSDLSGSELDRGIENFKGSSGESNLQTGMKTTLPASVSVQNNCALYLGNHCISLS